MAELRIQAECYGVQPTELLASVREFERPARMARAFKLAGPLVLGALVSLFIPVWHLFAVPAFLVASVVLGLRRFRQLRELEELKGPCPACRKDDVFPVAGDLRFPCSIRCPACGEFLKFSEAA